MRTDDWIQRAERRLMEAGIESARLEAHLLAALALGHSRSWVLAHPEDEIDVGIAEPLLQRRLAHEPFAYISGVREFYGRTFRVNPSVLIPRQETETLVDAALGLLTANEKWRVLDVGTGSGCLAVTLKLERPRWEVAASDVSEEALDQAQENARQLGADGVRMVLSDLFEAFAEERFDLVVTNPPYVAEGDRLMPEVAQWEPHQALFAGAEGLDLFRRISNMAPAILSEHGTLLAEVGDEQAGAVQEIFAQAGWTGRSAFRDLSGMVRALGFTFRA